MRISHITRLLMIMILNNKTSLGYEFLSYPEKRPGYMGAVGCQTSMCHGGAGPMSKQFTIWKQAGPHSKSFATLTTAWSRRIADSLEIENPVQHPDCTSCHAPLAHVEPAHLVSPALIREGVSCESCHGPASEWILSHTRTDYTHQQRVATGLKDQENLYVRADTCVACHQQIDPDILTAGHPKLEYDLAALQQRLPRHWEESWPDQQAWLVGQATSLREAAYVLHLWNTENRDTMAPDLCRSQIDLMQALSTSLELQTDISSLSSGIPDQWKAISATADELANELSTLAWSPQLQQKAVLAVKNSMDNDRNRSLGEAFLKLSDRK